MKPKFNSGEVYFRIGLVKGSVVTYPVNAFLQHYQDCAKSPVLQGGDEQARYGLPYAGGCEYRLVPTGTAIQVRGQANCPRAGVPASVLRNPCPLGRGGINNGLVYN